MESFKTPSKNEYTIYSKSGCSNCTKVKELLLSNNIPFIVIDCDEYLIEVKAEFLLFIQELTSREWKTFPMVFSNDGLFIGGFTDTRLYLEELLEFTDEF
jgi:glutaredoxin